MIGSRSTCSERLLFDTSHVTTILFVVIGANQEAASVAHAGWDRIWMSTPIIRCRSRRFAQDDAMKRRLASARAPSCPMDEHAHHQGDGRAEDERRRHCQACIEGEDALEDEIAEIKNADR